MSTPDDTDERRLRDLLRAAVPEAPEVSPPARPARSRGPVVAVLAAAAAVAAIAVVPLALGGDDPADRATTPPEPTVERTPLPGDPYAVDPCPAQAPRIDRVGQNTPDLDDATSIRLCSWPVDAGLEEQAPSPELQVPDDALLSGLDDLAADARALPGSDGDPCATMSYFDPYDTSLIVAGPDGRAVLSASPCESVTVGEVRDSAHRVNGGALADLVIEAIGLQRATSDYPRFSYSNDGTQDWCNAPMTVAPVVPADSDLAVAVLCPDYNVGRATPVELDDAALERLRAAWRETADPTTDPGFDGYDDELASIVALTSYGDLVRMVPKEGVDGLVLVVPRQVLFGQPTAVVPIAIDEITD